MGDLLLSRCFITIPPSPASGVGGVPLLDLVPFPDETRVGVNAPEPVVGAGVGARSQNNNFPYHFL